MEEARDTHFAGAAKALYEAVASASPLDFSGERTRALTAQFLYDFAVYIVEKLDASPLVTLSDRIGYHEKFVDEVPDMTEWTLSPEE